MPDNASAPQQGTAVATRESNNPLVQFREELEQRSNELRMALPAHISRDKFQRTMITAAQQNPGLLKASRKSLMLACMKAAQDGLLPDGREAALVPFKTSKKVDGQWLSFEEVAYIPMAFGIRKKVLQARDAEGKPVVSALQVGVVYRREVEDGHFLYEVGLTPPLRHRPMLDLTAEDTTDDKIVGAYSIAFMVDGPPSYEFMRRFEIDRVRESSQTGATKDRNAQPRSPKGPWVDHFAEMAKKTVLRRHSKTLPQSGDLIIEADDDEFDAGVSAVAVLASTSEDAPRAIEDRTDETPHDPQTGEVIEQPEAAKPPEEAAAETQPAKRARQSKAETSATGKPEGAAASANASDDNDGVTVEASAERDELGITKDPAEDQADEFLGRFKNAETVIDLEKAHGEFEQVSEGWPYEIVQAVESGYQRHRRRLGAPAAAQRELAE